MSHSVARQGHRDEGVDFVIDAIREHTRRRRGDAVINDGFIEWEKTPRVHELFSVDLNIFERIFFTFDVGETTSILSQITSFGLIFMIILSIAMWMISTLPDVQDIPANCTCSTECSKCAPKPAKVFQIVE